MTKKDYERIAYAIRNVRVAFGDDKIINRVINELCYELERDNPRFDGVKFKRAINGVPEQGHPIV